MWAFSSLSLFFNLPVHFTKAQAEPSPRKLLSQPMTKLANIYYAIVQTPPCMCLHLRVDALTQDF